MTISYHFPIVAHEACWICKLDAVSAERRVLTHTLDDALTENDLVLSVPTRLIERLAI